MATQVGDNKEAYGQPAVGVEQTQLQAPPAEGYAPQPQPQAPTGIVPGPTNAGPFRAWQTSFWDCFNPFDVCFLSCCCPCIQFGKTQHRLEDPSMTGYNAFNGNCLGFCALAYCGGLHWVFMIIKRGEMRQKFNLDGSTGGDIVRALCCACCELVQEEKESLLLTAELTGGAAAPQGYQKETTGMQYPAQPAGP
ncbi:MAG: hypothetical protein M1838_000370 [Thelocarpon superellum]|nr:MAG: hypothetical protein M1838_000370 [Thelocarpon superellum]